MEPENIILHSFLGKELSNLLQRNDITDIYVNDDGYIRYNSLLHGKNKTAIQLTPKKIKAIIEIIAGQAAKVVNAEIPSLSCEIQGCAARFQGELPPLVRNPQFNIRKQAKKIYNLVDYIESGALSKAHAQYLEEAVTNRKNILIAGGTGSGKTTFLNAILACIARESPTHRIISLEDLPELQCLSEDYSPMFTSIGQGDQKEEYDMCRLLADCMRRNPDRIIIGEVRDKAAYTMLKAWNTGHPGGVCTIHANSAEQSLTRIKSLAQEDRTSGNDLKELIGQAIDVIVYMNQVDDKDGNKKRLVQEVCEVNGYDKRLDEYLMKKI